MNFQTLVDVETLSDQLENSNWIIVDCRHDLADPAAGRLAYLIGHIPGAVHAHLDDDLSGPPTTDRGRHPLPTPEALCALFGRLGIGHDKQVVAYDDRGGAIAARLWWMLGYMGHSAAAVLDGGWTTWKQAGLPIASGLEENPTAVFTSVADGRQLVVLNEVVDLPLLVDSRDRARYLGKHEPIDPVAGHIPGAVNLPFAHNLDAAGRFQPVGKLRERFTRVIGDRTADETVFYCGSGVTACHNLLALRHAGLGTGRLYVGSWSEWCADPRNPVAR